MTIGITFRREPCAVARCNWKTAPTYLMKLDMMTPWYIGDMHVTTVFWLLHSEGSPGPPKVGTPL